MALPPIILTDFVGTVRVSRNTSVDERLTNYIDEWYARKVKEIIGAEAADTVENLGVLTQKWIDLFEGVLYFDISCDRKLNPEGLKKACIRLVWFYWMRDNFINTSVGAKRNSSENSSALEALEVQGLAADRWNDATEMIEETCLFVQNYNDFATDITGFTDDGGGLYTILTASTLYLEAGDTIKIDGNEFEVVSVTLDTDFVIDASVTGLSFVGEWIQNPYSEVDFTVLKPIF